MTANSSESEGQWLFEESAYPGEELGGLGSIEYAVVAGEVDAHQMGGGRVAVANDWALSDRADGEDRRLRWVDHRGKAVDPVHPEVGDGESRARQLGWRDLPIADFPRQRSRLGGDLPKHLRVGVEDR